MSQVYSFCKSGKSKTFNEPQNSGAKPQNSGTKTQETYNFKKDDFPSLGGRNTKVTIAPNNIGSWGNSLKSGVIREPFPEKVAAPKKNIPPLSNRVKKEDFKYYEDYEDFGDFEDYED
jgi:hypothetical protein